MSLLLHLAWLRRIASTYYSQVARKPPGVDEAMAGGNAR